MKILFYLFLLFCTISLLEGQNLRTDELFWDKSRDLTSEDFDIITDDEVNPIKSTVIISWELKGFSVFSKNFNQNVTNKMIRSASVINPNIADIDELLYYQQINFDLAEIYARKMRKDLFIYRSKLWKGFEQATELLNTHLAEYSKVQILMERETNSGEVDDKVKYWKDLIQMELDKTQQYDFQNTSKIDLEKDFKTNPLF